MKVKEPTLLIPSRRKRRRPATWLCWLLLVWLSCCRDSSHGNQAFVVAESTVSPLSLQQQHRRQWSLSMSFQSNRRFSNDDDDLNASQKVDRMDGLTEVADAPLPLEKQQQQQQSPHTDTWWLPWRRWRRTLRQPGASQSLVLAVDADREVAPSSRSNNDANNRTGSNSIFTTTESSRSMAELLAIQVFSAESIEAVKTIRSILRSVLDEPQPISSVSGDKGTATRRMDVFSKYRFTDIVASLIALSRLQVSALEYERREVARNCECDANCTSGCAIGCQCASVIDRTLIQELAHYAVYANAAYGWSMDLATQRRVHMRGDGQSLVRQTGVEPSDIVRAVWQSQTHRPAYFIVRDHVYKSIVVGIRGTWSAQDLLTDLCCTSQDFELDPWSENMDSSNSNATINSHRKGWIRQVVCDIADKLLEKSLFRRRRRCHVGMLQAARAVHKDCAAVLSQELKTTHPDYTLVLVGHSLGGGCAAILGTLLECQYPNAKIFCYGAPCVAPVGARLHRNIVSVVMDGDPFAYWSLGHVLDVSSALARLCQDPLLRHDVLWRTNVAPVDMNATDLEWCHETMESSLRLYMTAEKLYPPGRVLLLKRTQKPKQHGLREALLSRLPFSKLMWWSPKHHHWISETTTTSSSRSTPSTLPPLVQPATLQDVAPTHFRDLVVGSRMMDISQHVPARYVSTLRALANSYEALVPE